MIMIALVLISMVVMTVYLWGVIRLIGIPWSISDTYYQLKKRNKPAWLFQLTMIVCAFTLVPAWLEVLDGKSYQCLAFLSCAGMVFIGACPTFKLELEGKIHYISTAVCGLSALAWCIIDGIWGVPLTIAVPTMLAIYKWDKPMFWIEMWLLISTYIGVLVKTILL